MKLLYTPNSPFARKVRVLLRERKATAMVEECVVSPFDDMDLVRQANPLAKIPVLLLPEADPLFDSSVIVEYLDAVLPGSTGIKEGEDRWQTLRRQSLGNGVMDAAVAMTFERTRTDTTPSPFWMERWDAAVRAGVAKLETGAAALGDLSDAGTISIACALAYLDFRHPNMEWRIKAPTLKRWFEETSSRSSMQETAPG